MQIRYHLVGIHQGWDSEAGRVVHQPVCEDCTWRGSKEPTQAAAEEAIQAHRDSGEPISGLAVAG